MSLENTQMQHQMREAGVQKKKNAKGSDSSPTESAPTTGSEERDTAIQDCARRFTVLNHLFPDPKWFMVPRPENPPSDAARYDTAELKLAANIAELYEEVPASLHESLLKTNSFRKVVSRHPFSFW
jgi:hypothetical protein